MTSPLFTSIGRATGTRARIIAVFDSTVQVARASVENSAFAAPQHLTANTVDIAPYRIATFDLTGLTGGSHVDYDVVGAVDAQSLPATVQTSRRFKLLPVDRPLRVGLVSCNDLFHPKHVPGRQAAMWTHVSDQMQASNLDLLIHAGDQIYADDVHGDPTSGARSMLEDYRRLYVHTWSNPDVANALASCPSVMMWDDHEIYDGWGSNNGDRTTDLVKRFRIARQAFADFQVPHNPDPLEPGSFAFGFDLNDTGVLAVDGRSNRDYPNGVLLGDAQIRAIERWLGTMAPKELRHLLVVTGVPLVYVPVIGILKFIEMFGATPEPLDDLRDAWSATNNLTDCRRLLLALFNFAKNSPKTMVTILSGDVHVGALGQIESNLHVVNGRPLRLYQVTSSGIARPPPSGTEAQLLDMADAGRDHDLVGSDIVGRLLTVAGSDRRHMVTRRNFAVVSGSDADPKAWDAFGNLRVEYFIETDTAHGAKLLPQKLLRVHPPPSW